MQIIKRDSLLKTLETSKPNFGIGFDVILVEILIAPSLLFIPFAMYRPEAGCYMTQCTMSQTMLCCVDCCSVLHTIPGWPDLIQAPGLHRYLSDKHNSTVMRPNCTLQCFKCCTAFKSELLIRQKKWTRCRILVKFQAQKE